MQVRGVHAVDAPRFTPLGAFLLVAWLMYHMPPNNQIEALTNLDQPDALRRQQADMAAKIELMDHNNSPHGALVRGWGGPRYAEGR